MSADIFNPDRLKEINERFLAGVSISTMKPGEFYRLNDQAQRLWRLLVVDGLLDGMQRRDAEHRAFRLLTTLQKTEKGLL